MVKLHKKSGEVNHPTIDGDFHDRTTRTWRGAFLNEIREFFNHSTKLKESIGWNNTIRLPKSTIKGLTVEEAIYKRRSLRSFVDQAISLEELSAILFAAGGITGRMFNHSVRTVPSAGLKYPIELYVIVNNVHDLSRGLYRYQCIDHCLEKIDGESCIKKGTSIAFQNNLLKASVVIIMTGVFSRTKSKYRDRAYRFAYIEAGHTSQNIYLQATSIGLGTVCIGEYQDKKANDFLSIDGIEEAVLYIQPVGKIK